MITSPPLLEYPFKSRLSAAFTLVELAIVLVIIGLIIGGILMGADLVKSSQIQAQVAQINQLTTSVTAFQGKYNCLPGNCSTATTNLSSVRNGKGTGMILGYVGAGGCWKPATQGIVDINQGWISWGGNDGCSGHPEWTDVFNHLAAANMSFGVGIYDVTDMASNVPGVGYPAMKMGFGGMVIGWEPGTSYSLPGHKIRLGACTCAAEGWAANTLCFECGPTAKDALLLDTKMDDGAPYSGTLVAMGNSYTFRIPGSGSDATSGCGNSTTNTYRNSSGSCSLEVQNRF